MRYTQKQLQHVKRKREQSRINRDIELQMQTMRREWAHEAACMRLQTEAALNPMVRIVCH